MRMNKFLIQNYKKIKNSGWVDIDNLTAFVGKNESGKSSIFEVFEKFNDTSKYDQHTEYPRELLKNGTIDDLPVCSIEFIIDNDDVPENINYELNGKKSIIIKKNYENKYEVEYDEKEVHILTSKVYKKYLNDYMLLINEINGSDISDMNILESIIPELNDLINVELNNLSENIDSNTIIDKIMTLNTKIYGICDNWNVFNEFIDHVHEVTRVVEKHSNFYSVKKWIISNMPQFIYIKSYQLLELPIDTSQYIMPRNLQR